MAVVQGSISLKCAISTEDPSIDSVLGVGWAIFMIGHTWVLKIKYGKVLPRKYFYTLFQHTSLDGCTMVSVK